MNGSDISGSMYPLRLLLAPKASEKVKSTASYRPIPGIHGMTSILRCAAICAALVMGLANSNSCRTNESGLFSLFM